jgi:EAL domain-containing protein (putative c-di-GMP-specific phosphodiesterase class I)
MAVVQGMIAIAQALNVLIVIEGVETKEQLAFFQDSGCTII